MLERLKRVIDVAKGDAPADAVIQNCRVVDVYTRRILDERVVALSGNKIAYLGPPAEGLIGPRTEVFDLDGDYLLPGLIDGHTHLDSMWLTSAFVERALPFGNTTSITEAAMIAAALGPEGVELYCREASGLPMRIFFLSPSLAPPFPELETSAGFDDDAFERFIVRPEFVGLGETYWPPAVDGDERALYRFGRCQELGKSIEGHAAGARDRRLMAYRAGGVLSCHEAVTVEDARERLALGMAVQIREGYIRREMERVLPELTEDELDSGLVMLTTDVADPTELVSGQGGMNLLLRKAVALGVDPIRAVRMAALYPARHFGLRWLGGVAPGNLADLVAVEDLTDFEVTKVWTDGRLVAENGRMLVPVERFDYPDWVRRSFDIGPASAETFELRAPGERAVVRVVELAGETITKETRTEVPVRRGRIEADPARDLLKLAHLDRRGENPPVVGLVKGVGLKSGAVATSLIWDTNNVLVVGADDHDMAGAVNRLLGLGGGFVVWADGGVRAELAMPIGGIISELSLEGLVRTMDRLEAACRRLGWPEGRPFLAMQTLAFTGLPFLRLTDRGLVDVKLREMVEFIIESSD